jgi:hypothetical protein
VRGRGYIQPQESETERLALPYLLNRFPAELSIATFQNNHDLRGSKSRFLSKNPLPTLRESPGFRTAAALIPSGRRCCCCRCRRRRRRRRRCCHRPVTVSVHMTAHEVVHWGQNARASVTYRFRSPSARVDSRRPLAHPPPRAAAPPHDRYRRASGSSPTPTLIGKKPSPASTIMENRCPKRPRLHRIRLFTRGSPYLIRFCLQPTSAARVRDRGRRFKVCLPPFTCVIAGYDSRCRVVYLLANFCHARS